MKFKHKCDFCGYEWVDYYDADVISLCEKCETLDHSSVIAIVLKSNQRPRQKLIDICKERGIKIEFEEVK